MEGSSYRERRDLNVCLNNSGLVKSANCDHPCSEGFEVGNLISSNQLARNKGFLVERFIKPPVTLTFELSCETNLKYIFVVCNVGAQKTSGVELFIQSHLGENLFESVCSGVLKGNQKGFVFHRFSENVRSKFGEDFCFRSFKSTRSIAAVKSIRLKLFRTEGSSVPALGKVEIWGVPHILPSKSENSGFNYQNLSQKYRSQRGNETRPRHTFNVSKFCSQGESFSSRCMWPQNIKVPDDFIDPITCDIMCQPVTLPSGKVIDISTLESFEKAESVWGRSPSDPFTGIPFSRSLKPIAASDLKARIDKFLCDNSNNTEFFEIPRTVGRSLVGLYAQKVTAPSISKLITKEGQKLSETNNPDSPNSSNTNPAKRKKIEGNINHHSKLQSDFSQSENLAQPNSFPTYTVSLPKKSSPRSSFQERMETSLELSLKSTLSRLPSFTSDNEDHSEKCLVKCNVCELCDNLFSIPCGHFICRNCLLLKLQTKGSLSCMLCKSLFESHDVQKVHISGPK